MTESFSWLKVQKKDEILAQATKALGIDLILLLGSRADGTAHRDSDFNVAYRSRKPLASFRDIFPAVMERLGSENLHLLDIREVKPLTLYEIVRNCKVLYAEDMLSSYELRACAFRRYYDEVGPLYEIIFEKLKKRHYSV